jgi:uncharacterized membrane protein YphA (DoxX/SURF4 family)
MAALILGTRLFVGLLFLLAGLAKLADRQGFRRAVADHALLPERLLGPVAAALPWLELGAGGLVAAGVLVAPAAGLLGVLLLVFAAAVAVNLRRGRVISCGCGGAAGSTPISWGLVARNLLLAGVVGALAAAPPVGPAALAAGGQDRVASADVLAVVVVVLALLALARLAGQALEVRRALAAATPERAA